MTAATATRIGAAGRPHVFRASVTRPLNSPIERAEPAKRHRYATRAQHSADRESLVVLAFSGGGTRAAAFSHGVLEALREVEVVGRNGRRGRILRASPELGRLLHDAGVQIVPDRAGTAPEVIR